MPHDHDKKHQDTQFHMQMHVYEIDMILGNPAANIDFWSFEMRREYLLERI